MNEECKELAKRFTENGCKFSEDYYEKIYKHCLRKMDVAKIEDKEAYVSLLFRDEVKNEIVRNCVNEINAITKEVLNNVSVM